MAMREPASFATQANALLRKNATFQKRTMGNNVKILMVPFLLCFLLFGLELMKVDPPEPFRCDGCEMCNERTLGDIKICPENCRPRMQQLLSGKVDVCPVSHPSKWPALFQIPDSEFRATRSMNSTSVESCEDGDSCPVSILFTGKNRTLAEGLGQNLFGSEPFNETSDSMDPFTISSKYILGTSKVLPSTYFTEPAMASLDEHPLHIVQQNCKGGFAFPLSIEKEGFTFTKEVECLEGLHSWRENYSAINNPILMSNGNPQLYLGAYDFLNTNETVFNVTMWYDQPDQKKSHSLRILRALNAASNSYLQFFKGAHVQMLLEFVKEMPKSRSPQKDSMEDLSVALNPLLFTWIIELLFPVILINLVYEKQRNLRMIMKMHGLGDCPYWMINYAYFLSISSAYVLILVLLGSLVGLKSFKVPDYSVQFAFYFGYINLQIALAIFASTLFSDVKTASVAGYFYVFATGLLALMISGKDLKESDTVSYRESFQIQINNICPGFALYRGLYELHRYAYQIEFVGDGGHSWKDIINDKHGLLSVILVMAAEWPLLLLLAIYLDQVGSNGTGVRKHPLWFLSCFRAKGNRYDQKQGYDVLLSMENQDVSQEREKVERLVREPSESHVVICNDLEKVYPPMDGNPQKHAVRGLSLALPRGECFGILGPNGAGKTSFLSMMTGLTTPTAGTAFIQGLDIRNDMDKVYTRMGFCPQHDLIWDELTGREHLLFYGRLKNLEGVELTEAVEKSLRSVNLLEKGSIMAGKYSGGMKRRLSVAVSLIGDPIVVYMDEPSTGLDPASRKFLWTAVQNAKKDRVIILTTHSMEEAEFLCDRLGFFMDGSLKCLGNPKELKSRYGGYMVLTVTTPSNQEEEVEKMVKNLTPNANKVYHISGTQKFHLPKHEVKVAHVFREVENAKSSIDIQAWGLTDTTLEDVFVKVTKEHTQHLGS